MSLRRVYETTFIVNAALEDSDIEAVLTKVTGYIENNGGEIQEINKWGRRRLAYPINKKYNGYYIHIVFEAKPAAIPILERFLVLEDTVLRHLTLILPKNLRDYRNRQAVETGRTFDSAIKETSTDNKEKINKEINTATEKPASKEVENEVTEKAAEVKEA